VLGISEILFTVFRSRLRVLPGAADIRGLVMLKRIETTQAR
jgi:hypothetical protein